MEDTPMEPADASDEEMPAMETVPVEKNNDATAASAPSVNDVDDIPEPPPLMESTATGAPDQTAKKDSSDDDDDTLSIDSRESDVDFKGDPVEILVRATTLKEEGNAQFKEGDLSKACRSYRKGTNLLKPLNKNNTGDDQVKALLISLLNNHAMVLFRLKQYKTSRNVATHALQVDGENVKALYRRAVAQRKLGDVKEARDDLKQALKYDANNVAVRKELVSIKKQLEDSTAKEKKQLQKAFSKKSGSSFLYDDKEEEERKKEEAMKQKKLQEQEALEKRKVEWEDECVKRMAQGEEAISFEDWEKERKKKEKALEKARREEERIKREAAIKARTPPGGSSESVVIDSDDELTEKELAMLRGYKKTSDGRTTSYFHRELSEEEKKLLGTNTPKKIEQATAAQRPASITPSAEAGKGQASAWNQAGTWEEKNTSEWCNGHLRTKLSSATAELDNGAHVGVVTKVDSLTGDASVAVVSGKKRYIFDYHASLQYEIRDESVDEVIASGSFKLPDINSASHDELEVDVPPWSKPPTPAMEMNATQCRSLLIDSVRNAVQDFVNDFNAHY